MKQNAFFPVLALTGVLDPPTETAVRRFQSVVMQPEDGTVDRELWRRMTKASLAAGEVPAASDEAEK